ncbi:MAG: transposase [Erysipelotrichaceae bacterium]|nr:transposase [Erysipelotrichaceae bacterium]
MFLTVKHQPKLNKYQYDTLLELCRYAKDLFNEGLYNCRQYYFNEGEYLNYQKNYHLLKESENYKMLNSNMAQQILKEVDGCFKSFFGLLRKVKQGRYFYRDIRLPQYLKKEGYYTLVIGFVRLRGNKLLIPMSNSFRKTHKKIEITIPPVLLDKKVKEIRIIPKSDGRFFEIQYTYEADNDIREELDINKAISIDVGINNFATCVTSEGRSFILDGRRLKSINQWYNKNNSRLQSIKDKQRILNKTKQQSSLERNRNDRINDYISKCARHIINYCLDNNIGNIVIGYDPTLQKESNIGRRNNQNFVNIPFGRLKDKLSYLSEYYGINLIRQEESYTSKASFFDRDDIPVYNDVDPKKYVFSGTRVKRGLYKTSNGMCINADINGALNILKKSSVVSLTALYSRGQVDSPLRIRIA